MRPIIVELICPQCKMNGKSRSPIGSNRDCSLCRKFSSRVESVTLSQLKKKYRSDYEEMKEKNKLSVYPQIQELFNDYLETLDSEAKESLSAIPASRWV